jgi:hypothetical protein
VRRGLYTSGPVSVCRVWIVVCAIGLVVALGGCGLVAQPASSENDGVYVDAGPITYQLQVSRQLNPYGVEDREYLIGLPAGTTPTGLGPNQMWYGVFLWAKNQTDTSHLSSDNIVITDSEGDVFDPTTLDTSVNQYAWTSQLLEPGATQPTPSSTAYYGPTGGGLLLFKLPTAVYSNRPLTLWIVPAGGGTAAHISLDL